MPQSQRRRRKRGRLRALLFVLGVTVGVPGVLVGALRFVDPPTTSFMLQRRSEARRGGRSDFTMHQRWTDLQQLPRHVPLAVLSSEDQQFFVHRGFDIPSIKHAIGAHLQGSPLRGASTLTQQTAKNLFLWEERSPLRKGLEAYLTVFLELLLPKHRILEIYLNVAELGDGVFGIEAAAAHHFGVPARQLDREQAALLAAILPAPRERDPSAPTPAVVRKQRWILQQMRAGTLRAELAANPYRRHQW